MFKALYLSSLFLAIIFCGCNATSEKIIYKDVLNTSKNWVVEQQPKGTSTFKNNTLEVIDAKGCTIWFKNKLEGNIKIEYDITIINEGGSYDRVSDMNCFWMANDPNNLDAFFEDSKNRMGLFPNYHHLKLYYVGYGGHHNTKTRFRRYNGNINRPLLAEHDLSDKKFMITANKKMHITIIVKNNSTSYARDGKIIYKVIDLEPYKKGYFGFRTVNNHMLIEDFKVIQL
ncbi:DUF6250 domain-containing protein [Polaribacter glomeratus]|uniref:DUF6250 domain-containing protein n=1 Tax=Polaribacter glomeratus TaxID=102 RepID=A0A2S7WUJ4_9FLAO|nr:DUF6250 domain-containing protein [Polaribacter glomeratus]PQJ81248.1 hypothetical protein BTO16_01020 [Polaribacter glomeratus]TXD65804.1 hypothetical protein ESX12_09285 [Polaribacter glomeratus]